MSMKHVIDHIESRIDYPEDEPEWTEADYLAAFLESSDSEGR